MKLKHLFRAPNVEEERDFERENVTAKLDRYLATNPLDRFRTDPAYAAKVTRAAEGLKGVRGLILDLGGNTAGEATILQQQGFTFVVGDINEVALDISRQRCEKFGLRQPKYVAVNAHHLPFPNNTFSAVTILEALHHFPDYAQALSEVYRVLKSGGRLFSSEPNARNPIRRASEIRDRFRGTIETSFYRRQLLRLLREAGFSDVQVSAVGAGKSNWKMEEVPNYRKAMARLHGWLSENIRRYLGHSSFRHGSRAQCLVTTQCRLWKRSSRVRSRLRRSDTMRRPIIG